MRKVVLTHIPWDEIFRDLNFRYPNYAVAATYIAVVPRQLSVS